MRLASQSAHTIFKNRQDPAHIISSFGSTSYSIAERHSLLYLTIDVSLQLCLQPRVKISKYNSNEDLVVYASYKCARPNEVDHDYRYEFIGDYVIVPLKYPNKVTTHQHLNQDRLLYHLGLHSTTGVARV